MAGAASATRGGKVWLRLPNRLVWALGVTQIVGYGTLYYAFSVLAPAMAAEFAWPPAWIYGAFSAALLGGGLIAPWAGRLLDRYGAGTVMAWGSAAAAAALAATAMAPMAELFVCGLVLIEVVSAFVLYDAAFAALVQSGAGNAKRDITQLTLIAGFASTLFWPMTSLLDHQLGWRETYLVFALLNLALCVPLHLWIAGLGRKAAASWLDPARVRSDAPAPLSRAAGKRAFLLIALGFSLGGFVLSALLVHLPPVLAALGHGADAALIAMIFGPAQVLGRVVNMTFGRSLPPVRLAILSAALLPAAIALLAISGSSPIAAFAFALSFGLGSGLVSIVRGTVPLALFGSEDYGARLGRIAAVRLVLSAVAPFAFALAIEGLGVERALVGLAVLGTLGALAFIAVERLAMAVARRP